MGWRILAVILGLACCGQAMAQTPQSRPGHWLGCWTRMLGCPSEGCCPDDYCRKPMRCLTDLPRIGTCDDYCRKPMPCLTDVPRSGSCDDYCRKPMPSLLCPPWSPYLKCAPPEVRGVSPSRP